MVFFSFFNFCAFFQNPQFRFGLELIRKIFLLFYFHSFSAFLNLFWLEEKQYRCFLIFFNFFEIFLGILYSGSGRNSSERFFFFFFTFSQPFPSYFALKEAITVFFNFFGYFFGILNYGLTKNSLERFFSFLSFSTIPNQLWLENKP